MYNWHADEPGRASGFFLSLTHVTGHEQRITYSHV